MKKAIRIFCLLSIVIFTSSEVHSQTTIYHPFPDSNAIWVGHYWPGLINCGENYAYIISGDTAIGNLTYHKLFIPYVNSYGICTVNHTAGYNGCFRQDLIARKVFYITPGNLTEDLLYDFTLQVGDTIPGFTRLGCTQPTDTITQVDSMLIGTNYRRVWHFGQFVTSNTIIEGIGFISGILEGCATNFPDGPFYLLDCFQQNGTTLYPDTLTSCQLQSDINGPSRNSIRTSIYPNPFSCLTTVKTNQHLVNASLTIYNSLGQQVKQINNISGQTLTLNRDNLPAGLYYIHLSEEGKILLTDKLVVND